MTDLAAALRDVDAAADRFVEGKHIPGTAYGIVADGRLVHARGIGTLRVGEDATPDADSVFRIASMTKSFTAATILGLRDEGRLALDDPIARHVPELEGLRGPTADSPPITVRHLLTMSAGLATDDPWGDRQQGLDLEAFAELLRGGATFAWAPGTRFEYSNLGYGILGRLITNVAGREYREVVRDRLLDPLGMTASGYLQAEVPAERLARGYLWRDGAYVAEPIDGYGALAAMGGLFSSIRDLARWVGFFLDAFPARDDPEGGWPLRRATRREQQQIHRAMGADVLPATLDAEPRIAAVGYGMGLFIIDDVRLGRVVGHSGGYPGYGSNMRWHPASGLGVIVLTNHRYGPATVLARDLMIQLLEAGARPARRIRPAPAMDAARAAVEQLLEAWDDELAARTFAMNVDLDEPIDLRRTALEKIRETHGRLRPETDPSLPVEADTPLALRWWLRGERGGRVRVELLLSPEQPPRVQTFGVTSVPEPPARLAELAEAIVASLADADPRLPAIARLGPAVDRTGIERALRIAAVRFQPARLGPVVAGDGTVAATWRLLAGRTALELTIEQDSDAGTITRLALAERPPEPPPHED